MHFYITFQLPHDVHGATRVTKVLPAEQELIEQKFRARRAVGWKGGGSNR